MRKTLVAVALLGAAYSAVTTSYAADVEPGCADNWSGFYVGAHAGYAFGDSDTVGLVGDADWKGFIGGPLAGYNFQFCDFVLGLEGDAGFGEVDDSDGLVNDIDLEPNGHARLRLGMPFDNIMPFVAGGLAVADIDLRRAGVGKDSEVHFGFTVGGGLDFMATENIVVRAEYLFDWYGEENYNIGPTNVDVDGYSHTIRGALIWKF
jgi:outer membrane immunogenic protein